MKFEEMMFYAEAEGLLPTRAGRINKVIQDIKNFPHYTIDFNDFEKILKQNGLDWKNLSPRERKYIDASIK